MQLSVLVLLLVLHVSWFSVLLLRLSFCVLCKWPIFPRWLHVRLGLKEVAEKHFVFDREGLVEMRCVTNAVES